MIDPNLHLCYREPRTGRPLSVAELALYTGKPGPPLTELAEFGTGYDSQRERLDPFARNHCLTGGVYRLWGVWARHDWITRPDLVPPAHGSMGYTETDILWCATSDAIVAELGMFPHFLTPEQLALPADRDSSSPS